LKRAPSIIDKHVGARLRERRGILGVTQQQLGVAIGVSFQQIQKYEKGLNRIGAGRLREISRFLGVSPAYFYEGSPVESGADEALFEIPLSTHAPHSLNVAEGLQLQRCFARIENPRVRKRIVELVMALAMKETP
jgi:transcriptional regulator with XRE-family HTH domain